MRRYLLSAFVSQHAVVLCQTRLLRVLEALTGQASLFLSIDGPGICRLKSPDFLYLIHTLPYCTAGLRNRFVLRLRDLSDVPAPERSGRVKVHPLVSPSEMGLSGWLQFPTWSVAFCRVSYSHASIREGSSCRRMHQADRATGS